MTTTQPKEQPMNGPRPANRFLDTADLQVLHAALEHQDPFHRDPHVQELREVVADTLAALKPKQQVKLIRRQP